MEKFCGSKLWDSNLGFNETYPDFTKCFKDTFLVWTPMVFLCLFLPLEFWYIFHSLCRDIPRGWIFYAKMSLTTLLLLISIFEEIFTVIELSNGKKVYPVDFVNPVLKIFLYELILVIIVFNQLYGISRSGLLFWFWALSIVSEGFRLRSELINIFHKGRTGSVLIPSFYVVIFLIQFMLTFFREPLPRKISYSVPEKLCPENFVPYPSMLKFSWVNDLISKGNKKPLQYNDLWGINYELSSRYITPLFDKHFKPATSSKVPVSTDGSGSIDESSGVISGSQCSSSLYEQLNKDKGRQNFQREKSILPTLWRAFHSQFTFAMLLSLVQVLLSYVNPQILKLLIIHVNSQGTKYHERNEWKGYLYSVLLFVTVMGQTILSSQYFIRIFTVALKVRIALTSVIYRKALLLSNSAKKERTTGEIVNLMAVDVNKCADALPFVNMLMTIPLRIILALFCLWEELGYSVLACLLVLITLLPAQIFGATSNKRFQIKEMKFKDDRIKLMTEVLTGFKALRLYAWETFFERKILKIRRVEVKYLKFLSYILTLMSFFWLCTPYLMAMSSFACFVLTNKNNVLTPQIAFVSLSLFNLLQVPLALFPLVMGNLIQAYVSLRRINKYLNSEELNEDDITHDINEDDVIVIENGTFSYGDVKILNNINLRIPPKSLVAVVGSVGAGKSSLIAALLGDVVKLTGRVNIKGKIAYVPQQSWIQNGTVRDNILFGKPFNKEQYESVIMACALNPDFLQFPAGDLTEITAKGDNLSGGQKQRISIARAVYSGAEIYLMDDPLSAVDSQVGKYVFDSVIGPDGLLSEKTRLVVTQSVNNLHYYSRIIMLNHGIITEEGTFNDLLSLRGSFSLFVLHYLTAPSESFSTDMGGRRRSSAASATMEFRRRSSVFSATQEVTRKRASISSNQETGSIKIRASDSTRTETSIRLNPDDSLGQRVQTGPQVRASIAKINIIPSTYETESFIRSESPGPYITSSRLKKTPSVMDEISEPFISLGTEMVTEEESAETGSVKLTVYSDYLKSMGVLLVAVMLTLYTLHQVFQCGGNIWLSHYTDKGGSSAKFLFGYALFGCGQIICIGSATLLINLGALIASKNLHNAMLHNVMRLPLMFFNITPYGRILNRFSRDVEALDSILPMSLQGVVSLGFTVVGIIIVIAIFIPTFILFIIPLVVIYCIIQRYYVAVVRQLKRLESINRSPIYTHFEETLSGASSIRAYGEQKRFIEEYDNIIERSVVCIYPGIICDRWLQVRLELVGNLIIFLTALCAAYRHHSMSPGDIGLTITYALSVTMNLNMLVRNVSLVETNIVAAERIKEYTMLPQEGAWRIQPNTLSDRWPHKGEIRFQNFTFRYRDGLNYALKSISFTVKGGEKVGIVGRTGAGKSSLTMALFRVVEAVRGKIYIDDVDISTIGLHTLRSRLTIIPQEPILFSGTLRRNLDPGHQYKDRKLQHALETAHLPGLATHLDLVMSEGGENFSAGQCQLLCLARALLRKTKVLVLDEATANIDLQTEELIQETIRNQFSDCTILTIAHRIKTILDSDKVLVLANGRIAEYDSPEHLLQNKNSIFYSLAKDADIT